MSFTKSFASVHTNPHPPSFSRNLPNHVLGSDHKQDLFDLPSVGPSIEVIGANYSEPAPSKFGNYNIYHNRCQPGCKDCICSEYSEPRGECLKWQCIDPVRNATGQIEKFEGSGRRQRRGPSIGVIVVGGALLAALVIFVCSQTSGSRKK